MALPDLLQWASVNRKTGLFRLHRNQLVRGIAFDQGQIAAAATTDPSLIAHYLISSGKVRAEAVHDAVVEHRETGTPLSRLVLDRGLVTAEQLEAELRSKSEETIYSLFDWGDAEFSFEEEPPDDPMWVTVDTSVDEILLSGLQRLDEMKMIRKVFHSSGMVLELTGQEPPKEITHSGMARRILRSIDGKRTLAQVLVTADASEFLVLKLLYHLTHKQVTQIAEVRPPEPGSATLLDDPEELRQESPSPPTVPSADDAVAAVPEPLPEPLPEPDPEPVQEASLDAATLNSLAEVARQLEAGIHDVAAGAAAADSEGPAAAPEPARELPLESVPVPLHTPEMLAELDLNDDEEYLVSVIDGRETLQGILSLAPLDAATLTLAVHDLLDKRLIRLDEPT